jgi:molybdopterin-guanine dinucleotide biosynthesis protein A
MTDGKTGTATAAAWPEAVGFVLAGGESRRMGEDKALVPFAGRTLVEQAVQILRDAGLAVSIAGARLPLERFAPVVNDGEPGLGPLGGICAALEAMTARRAVFLPVDLPLVPACLIELLLSHAEITGRAVTVPSVNGFTQTFPAVIDQRALPVLRGELEAGRGGCFAAFQTAANRLGESVLGESITVIPVELAVHAGQLEHPMFLIKRGLTAARWFLNVNARPELEQAEVLFR